MICLASCIRSGFFTLNTFLDRLGQSVSCLSGIRESLCVLRNERLLACGQVMNWLPYERIAAEINERCSKAGIILELRHPYVWSQWTAVSPMRIAACRYKPTKGVGLLQVPSLLFG